MSVHALKTFFLVGVLLIGSAFALYAQEPPSPDETYRLRIENVAFGKVEISTDSGKHYRLLGRVSRPAKSPMVDRSASKVGEVLRSTRDFFTFSVALGQSVVVSPLRSTKKPIKKGSSSSAPPTGATIQTNLPPTHPLFTEFAIPENSRAFLQPTPGFTEKMGDSFTLGEEDIFVFPVTLSGGTTTEALEKKITALADAYQAGAVERAKANKTDLVSGVLTLQPQLPTGEPDPIVYVTYAIDGDQVAAQNTEPYNYEWDTKQASNGEHLIEIRALNRQGNLITRARVLVVVNNSH